MNSQLKALMKEAGVDDSDKPASTSILGSMLADMVIYYHNQELATKNKEMEEVVLVKTVALLALAFDIPPTEHHKIVDIDEAKEILSNSVKKIKQMKEEIASASATHH